MSMKFAAAIAVLTAVSAMAAVAQDQSAPKASKAEVQKVVSAIKSDKTKFAQYCEITKLEIETSTLAQKNQDDPKLQKLGKQMQDIAAKLGPDYEKIINSELDDASAQLFDDLSKGCNVGFEPYKPAPKTTKAEVEKVVNAIKGDKAKLAQFCQMTKLASQADALAGKSQNDPKLKELGKEMQEIAEKLGPDYQRITSSDLDEAAAAPLDGLYDSCK